MFDLIAFDEMDSVLKEKELQLKNIEIEAKREEVEKKVKEQRYKTDSERDIELRYLDFQRQELAINAQTQRAQILMQDIKNKLEISSKRSKEKVKD